MIIKRNTNSTNGLITWVFYGLIGLFLWPVVTVDYLVTHDGPAHLYNSELIRDLIFANTIATDFLELKKFPEPNWTGHFLLASISSLVSPRLAEKFFLGAYVILLPIFFRKTLQKINGEQDGTVFLIFPFLYSYFFTGGLYNFLTGVTLLFAALYLILPRILINGNRKYYLILIFSLALYFSHLLVLGVFLILILLANAFTFFNSKHENDTFRIKNLLLHFVPLILSLMPVIILLLIFFSNKFSLPSGESHVTFSEMIDALINISPIITLQVSPENIYSMIINALLVLLLVAGTVQYLMRANDKNNMNQFYKRPVFWFISSLLMLMFFFLIPDQAASGGVIKFRFELFFYLFLIIFISTLPWNRIISIGTMIIVSIWVVFKLIYLYPKLKSLSNDATTAMQCVKQLNENSILLPLNYSPNWMHCNLLNYIGTEKHILVLDNYEAGTPHFPLEWKKGMNPVNILGNFNIEPPPLCAEIGNFKKQTGHSIDYILVWQYQPLTDSCTLKIQSTIESDYELIYNDPEFLKLYTLKN